MVPFLLRTRFRRLLGGLALQLAQIGAEAVEPRFPCATRVLGKLRHVAQGLHTQAAGALLGVAPACDQACALEHLQVPRDGRQADVEGLGQLEHRGISLGQAQDDGPTCGIGQSGERGVELGWCVHGPTPR